MKIRMQTQIKNKTFKEALKEFIFTKESNNLAEDTINDYIAKAKMFTGYFGENSPTTRNHERCGTGLYYASPKPTQKE